MRVFDFDDYREIIQGRLKLPEWRVRGAKSKLARFSGIKSASLSQVLHGSRMLTPEQGERVCAYFDFTELETRYFLNLLLGERAGTSHLRAMYERERKKLRASARDLSQVLKKDKELTDEERVIFYSSWHYSAIRNLCAIKGYQSVTEIAQYLGLARSKVAQAVEFLLRAGLCSEKGGLLSPALKYTHLEASSPFVSRHHANWRLKAMSRHEMMESSELAFSSPMTLSKADAEKVRQALVEMIKRINQIRDPSPSETLWCLGLDWFRV